MSVSSLVQEKNYEIEFKIYCIKFISSSKILIIVFFRKYFLLSRLCFKTKLLKKIPYHYFLFTDLENILLTDEKMKTNGIGLILHPRPNGQDISISDPSHSNYEGISSRLPHGASAKDVVFLNKTEAVNTVVKAPSISIERPKSCASCFKTSDFHHFCLDGEVFNHFCVVVFRKPLKPK